MESLAETTLLSWSFILFSSFSIVLGFGIFFISDFAFRTDKLAERIVVGFFVLYFVTTVLSIGIVFAGVK